MMAVYIIWDYWKCENIYYSVYEVDNRLCLSEAKASEVDKIKKELLKKKPKIFGEGWLKKLFRKD